AGVQLLQDQPLYLGMLLVPATFFAFLAGAWGSRGLPVVISIMFAMTFSMAVPRHLSQGNLLTTCIYFTRGSLLYVLYATLAPALLHNRYRQQLLAQSLPALSSLLPSQADRCDPASDGPPIGELMQKQAQLAEQLQAARDVLLESPRTPR